MRILIVSQYCWPENLRINDLMGELVARGHQVTVLTGKPNYPGGTTYPEFLADPSAYTEYRGAEIVRVPMLARGRGRMTLALNYLAYALSASTIGAWRLRGREFDVIFTFAVSPVTVCLPAVVQRVLKRRPSVYWILDQWPESLAAVGAFRSTWVLGAVGLLVRFLYRRCDLLLGQSRRMLPVIADYGSPGQRVEYFPSWAEDVFDGREVAPATELPPRDGRFDVMYAGNIGETQDFPGILAAAELLRGRGVRWLLVGDGRMAAWVRAEVARRGLGAEVLLLGQHPLERMPAFFRRADALLVSLRAEPIFAVTVPGKVQAYLAAGVPIVAQVEGEGADVVEASGAGVVCRPGDAAGLAAAVLELAGMEVTHRQAMGARGRHYYLHQFDRAAGVTRLEGLLASVVH